MKITKDGDREIWQRAGEILLVWRKAVTVDMERSGQNVEIFRMKTGIGV